MDTKHIYRLLALIAFSTLWMGQTPHKSKKQLIEEAIQEKVDKYTQVQMVRCENKVQERAEAIVDSMLISVAQLKTVDTFERPAKPQKPTKPDLKVAKDTTPVRPLFDQ